MFSRQRPVIVELSLYVCALFLNRIFSVVVAFFTTIFVLVLFFLVFGTLFGDF